MTLSRISINQLVLLGLLTLSTGFAETEARTLGLVRGGSFVDRILPAPLQGELRSDVWGGENVLPRDVSNGIEDATFSYWGGNMITGDDGLEHLFVCRWREDISNNKKSGHHLWWASTVVHAVSESPMGPFTVREEIGKGHNPEVYRRKDGSYVIGVMGEKAYQAASLDGPWTLMEVGFDFIGEPLNKTNRTYVVREDGSVLMVNKNGYVYISEGANEQFKQVTAGSVYSEIAAGHLEDPVIWKDEVQYHLIVNDWKSREAYYLRSPDGIDWQLDPGFAYTPGIMRHEGGTVEDWYKFERPKVRQDEFGRATHINFAVIDSIKDDDLANDRHSSKNIVLPLVVSRRLEILNSESSQLIQVKLLAEDGFDPTTEVDVSTLHFGAATAVNHGRGAPAIDSATVGVDLVLTFQVQACELTADDFASKLIGRGHSGELILGYSKWP